MRIVNTARYHPLNEMSRRAMMTSVDYVEAHMPEAVGFATPDELMSYALSQVSVVGHFAEFGVFNGATLRAISRAKPQEIIHGFDTFEGLPESWHTHTTGAFDLQGRLPRVPKNVSLHQGMFSETIPVWKSSHEGPLAFLHIDCDLYQSTKDVFVGLGDRIVPSTIILFDEYFNYPNWQIGGEYRAFKEFRRDYRYLGYSRMQVAVVVTQ